ncbi:MAG: hypothetical protein AAF602_18620 [Myxococcota bacterium]
MPRTDPIRRALEALEEPIAAVLRDALDEPGRRGWAHAVLGLVQRFDSRDVALTPTCLTLGDTVVAFAEGSPPPAPPEVLAGLDRVFAGDGYLLRLRQPLPDDIDLEPIQQSLRLWLTARAMSAEPAESVTYDHDGVSLEFTRLQLVDGGRRAMVGPFPKPPKRPLDDAVEDEPDANVLAVLSGQRFGRRAVQTALYGRAQWTHAVCGPEPSHEIGIPRGGWLGKHPEIRAVWWLDAEPAPFGTLTHYVNPWSPEACVALAHDQGWAIVGVDGDEATLRWTRAERRGA